MNEAKSQALRLLKLAAVFCLVLAFCVPASAQCSWPGFGNPPTASGNPPTGTFVLDGMRLDYLNLFPEYHGVGCKFTRTTDVSWITLSDFRYPAGYDFSCIPNVTCPGSPGAVLQIAYSFEPNPTSQPRTGHIFISGADQILTVNVFEAAGTGICDLTSKITRIPQRALLDDGKTVDLMKSPWANDFYDGQFCRTKTGSFCTIGNSGCNMIVTLMATKFADPTIQLDPSAFNNFLESIHDYTPEGGVQMDPAVRDASKAFSTGKLKLHTLVGFNEIDNSPSLADIDAVLCQGFPVIIGVDINPMTTRPGHYVLVTGQQGTGDHHIIDPGSAGKTSLASDYGNKFLIRGYVADPIGDISSFDLFGNDTVELLVVDGAGNGTGLDGNSHQLRHEIVRGYHFVDSMEDDESFDPPLGSYYSVGIFQPKEDIYRVVLTGLKNGPYSVSVKGYSQDGTAQTQLNLIGSAAPGSTATFLIHYTPTGPAPTVTSVLGDLNGDGKVDCADVSIVKAAFGKAIGQPGFDPRADVNLDGVVNIRDLAFVSQKLPTGTRCL